MCDWWSGVRSESHIGPQAVCVVSSERDLHTHAHVRSCVGVIGSDYYIVYASHIRPIHTPHNYILSVGGDVCRRRRRDAHSVEPGTYMCMY